MSGRGEHLTLDIKETPDEISFIIKEEFVYGAQLRNFRTEFFENFIVKDAEKRRTIIDFANVAYLDAESFSIIAKMHRALTKENREFYLINPNEEILEFIGILNLDPILQKDKDDENTYE